MDFLERTQKTYTNYNYLMLFLAGIRTNILSFSAKSVAAKENINNTKILTKDLSNDLLNNKKRKSIVTLIILSLR